MKVSLLSRSYRRRSLWMILSFAVIGTLFLTACGGSSTATTSTPTATTAPTATPTTAPTPTPSPTATPTVAKVSIVEKDEKYSFSPASLTIKAGTQVVWTNVSDAPHTVTSDNGAFTASSPISEHQTFKMTFSTAGTYHYHCSFHPYMTATIVVTS